MRPIVFDLGGVLIDWDPRHLYRKLFDGEAEMERFLTEVCTQEWNEKQDEGRPFAEGVAELVERHPDQRPLIEAYAARWAEMMGGSISDSVEILGELRSRGHALYALSNFSAETFPHARERFDFLDWFDGIVISGEVRTKKPEPEIFRVLLTRHGLEAERCVFVDDIQANVEAAQDLGFEALHFTSAAALRDQLGRLGLL